MSYAKPHLTYQQQVELLMRRGMVIDDVPAAVELLSVIGYYRKSV